MIVRHSSVHRFRFHTETDCDAALREGPYANDEGCKKADDAYVRQSILQPDAATVEGYSAGVMAAGIERHKARIAAGGTVDALLAYIKSLE